MKVKALVVFLINITILNGIRNRLSSSEMQIRDEILNDNYEEITHRKF